MVVVGLWRESGVGVGVASKVENKRMNRGVLDLKHIGLGNGG